MQDKNEQISWPLEGGQNNSQTKGVFTYILGGPFGHFHFESV